MGSCCYHHPWKCCCSGMMDDHPWKLSMVLVDVLSSKIGVEADYKLNCRVYLDAL